MTRWRSEMVKVRGLKPATVNRRVQALRRFYRWAVEARAIETDPMDGVKTVRVATARRPAGLRPPEAHALLRAAGQSGRRLAARNYALPVESAPDRSRLVSLGQAQLRSGAEGRVLTSAIAAGELAVYRAPAGPRAMRDAAWLDHLDVDRWAATRQSIARRDEWVAARVMAKGVVQVPAWPLGVEPGDSVEYRIEGEEIRIRRSKTPRAKRRGGRRVPAKVRRDAVRRVVDGGESLSPVARSLGVSHRSVGNWVQAEHGCTLTELRARE